MGARSVLQAASALRDIHDQIETLQGEKDRLQARINEINAKLALLRAEFDIRAAALKQEAGTI